MSKRITENDLRLPALYVIYMGNATNTTQIKNALIDVFRPTGEDAEILAGRNDTKFSQIVRNLLGSHFDTNGMQLYARRDEKGYFSITRDGRNLVEASIEYLQYLFENHFSYDDNVDFAEKIHNVQMKKHTLLVYSEDNTITEGKMTVKQAKVRERSKKLRDAAIKHYTVDGKIVCFTCGFDFAKAYGKHGEGYIQVHHEKPVCQYDNQGFNAYISEAVTNMKPLCANCHCMIHRKRNPITVAELERIVFNAQTSRS